MTTQTNPLFFDAYGVRIRLDFPDDLGDQVNAVLPPAWEPLAPDAEVDLHFDLAREEGKLRLAIDSALIYTSNDRVEAVDLLDAHLRMRIATGSPDFVFVHAGAVALRGHGILIPGRSFSGKSTLVAELVRQGASYLSDEFALLDGEGNVHPYPRPVSLRVPGVSIASDVPPEALGGTAASTPARTRAVLVTEFDPEAVWHPEVGTLGTAAMALLHNTPAAREHPDRVLSYIGTALGNALVLVGPRGEAGETAAAVLAQVAAHTSE